MFRSSDLESRLYPFVTTACPRRSMLFVTFFLRCFSMQLLRFRLPVYQETICALEVLGTGHGFMDEASSGGQMTRIQHSQVTVTRHFNRSYWAWTLQRRPVVRPSKRCGG
eukprot:s246_g19.t1